MTGTDLMVLLKSSLDLIMVDDNKQALLNQCLSASRAFIAREGITLQDTIEDAQLIVMYAAYLYRKRAVNEPMPRMLRWALNNRLFSEKAGGGQSAT